MPDNAERKPKNIVLLSDGTGNSAGKLFKTNVWRLYDALDLRDPAEQAAYYNDGVGTSGFRPLALLGGAMGFGLKRNVLSLYRFLCEQYEPGDRIYAFGFSRGAFTIRVLAALVADQGIIRVRADSFRSKAAPPASARTTMTSTELRRLSVRAYQHFRHHFDQTLRIVGAGRWLRDHWFDFIDAWNERKPYDPAANHPLQDHEITFLGLWDTVDAYGLPIDELTDGVNRWIWPLSLPELALSPKVGKACHAIALDDERHTFHPVLWDEAGEKLLENGEERILQVWFAGAHANVGGGYPNDALSAVSLDWIAKEARAKQLKFLPDHLKAWTERRDPFGTVYDSRRGVAAFYRYSPRRIEYLTNGQRHEQTFRQGTWPTPNPIVRVDKPKIHESVFERIKAAPDFYAPIGLPATYAVVRTSGAVVDGAQAGYETVAQSRARVEAQEAVWDIVWWRRLAYILGVAATVALVAWPMRDGAEATAEIAVRGGGLPVTEFVGGFLPEAASPWLNYYAAAPWELALFLIALGWILLWGRTLRSRIDDGMHMIWRWVMAPRTQADVTLPERKGLAYWIRSRRHYYSVFAVFRRNIIPDFFGLLMLLWVVASLNRVAFEVPNGLGVLCSRSSAQPAPVGTTSATHTFDAWQFCSASGLSVERGGRYQLTATLDGVLDYDVPVMRADGFGVLSPDLPHWRRPLFALAFPFKRLWWADWLAVVARVGETGVEQIALGQAPTSFTARNDGELFLFVNDAIAPVAVLPGATTWAGWGAAYSNNRGTATVTITRVD
jgi:uncharacterized protein (DUF2235 family)